MASPGEVRTNLQELGLMFARFIVFVGSFLLVGFVGLIINLPGAIAGLLGGLTGFLLIVGTSMFEVRPTSCPNCGRQAKVIKNTGSFECPQCGQSMYIYDGSVKTIEA
ncbi:MAG: hypothetical protein FH756_16700 [Firmicutes bacterium]|nr:hypothetical protein [Bacillota bacterium]